MNKTKKCSKCEEEKPVSEFHKDKSNSTGFYSCCKKCKNKYMSKRWRDDTEYRARKKNKDSTPERREYFRSKIAEKRKDPGYREKQKKYMREYWKKNNPVEYQRMLRERNPEYAEKVRQTAKVYRNNNREKYLEANKLTNSKRRKTEKYKKWRNQYEKNRRDSDPQYRAMISCRNRIRKMISRKTSTSKSLLGCIQKVFVCHLEKQFEPWMTWDNYGEKWHIDHIIPCNYFDLTISEEQMICFNYRNLQPLSVSDNCRKQDSLPDNADELYEEIKKALE